MLIKSWVQGKKYQQGLFFPAPTQKPSIFFYFSKGSILNFFSKKYILLDSFLRPWVFLPIPPGLAKKSINSAL
jgi:hypothetical protein